jgi:hypothetical protein
VVRHRNGLMRQGYVGMSGLCAELHDPFDSFRGGHAKGYTHPDEEQLSAKSGTNVCCLMFIDRRSGFKPTFNSLTGPSRTRGIVLLNSNNNC